MLVTIRICLDLLIFFNEEIDNPIALSEVYGDIGQNFKTNLLGSGAGGGMNEDKAGNDMSRFFA